MRTPPRHPGFTMVELLVAMGIMVLVASITLVAYSKIMGTADRTRIGYQFQTISAALEAYKTDFNSFPVTSLDDADIVGVTTNTLADLEVNRSGLRGARTLCKALMGATDQGAFAATATPTFDPNRADQDGADGFGFRVPSRSGVWRADPADNTKIAGKVYGPYLATDKFKVSRSNTDGTLNDAPKVVGGKTLKYDDTAVLLDANNYPILYYPVLNPQPTMTIAGAFIGATGPTKTTTATPLPMYRSGDNSAWLNANELMDLLGDKSHDGKIDATETAAARGKYILYSPGPDGFYGVNTLDVTKTAKQKADKLDDVSNLEP